MKILARAGTEQVSWVYLAETERGMLVEFAEAVEPPKPREEKWVLLVSSTSGCPIKCKMCDAGGEYRGKLTAEEILAQTDYMVKRRYPDLQVPAKKFKVQFARMGEPSLNPAVLDALEALPQRYDAPGLIGCLSTVAPRGTDRFFQSLLELKERLYRGRFQLQFSVHSTDERQRDWIIPVKKWPLEKIAEFGESFVGPWDRKITLNFALAEEYRLDPDRLREVFNPEKFLVKITPLNPTYASVESGLRSYVKLEPAEYPIVKELEDRGFQVIVSIGEPEENLVGSNCGQLLKRHLRSRKRLPGAYTYPVEKLEPT